MIRKILVSAVIATVVFYCLVRSIMLRLTSAINKDVVLHLNDF